MIKKTFNINLAGRAFVIDDDAYTLASDYLDTIEHLVRDTDERRELCRDIEDRMAELLAGMLEERHASIVTIEMVEAVIKRIGQPDDFIETDREETTSTPQNREETAESTPAAEANAQAAPRGESSGPVPPPFDNFGHRTRKRLYRDPRNAVFGGVCSGIANWLGTDPIWVRLLFVVLAVISTVSFSTVCFIYILLWIIIPPAETPLQRMEMFGQETTLSNIGKSVTGNGDPADGGYPANGNRFIDRFSYLIQTLGRGIMIMLGVIGFPIAIGLILGILGILFCLIMAATQGLAFLEGVAPEVFTGDVVLGLLCALSWCVTILVPTILCCWYFLRILRPQSKMSRTWEIVLAIMFILGFISSAITSGLLGIS